MGRAALRSAASALLLGLCLWGGWSYVHAPGRGRPGSEGGLPPAPAADAAFHAVHRFEVAVAEEEKRSPCWACHGPSPHWRSRTRRAFLNLHTPTMDCGACHLAGASVRRFRAGEAVTRESLAEGSGGRLYAARREGDRWTPLLGPTPAARLLPAGPPCGECHRRGSTFLAGEGLFDPYRRRVLEDLAVLRRMGDRAW